MKRADRSRIERTEADLFTIVFFHYKISDSRRSTTFQIILHCNLSPIYPILLIFERSLSAFGTHEKINV